MKGPGTMTIGLGALLLLSACGGGETAVEANATDATAPVTAPAETPAAPAAPVIEATATTAAAVADQSLDAFWTKVRAAALANDTAGIAALSAPTVMQHGELDDSPKQRLTPRQVAPVLAKILAKEDGIDPQGRPQRALLEAAASPPESRSATADSYRFGDMEFTRGSDGWRLTAIYYEPDE